MKIYIVIPAHNEQDLLAGTLESLIGQSHPASKIVVVDDNSTDGTQDIIEQYSAEHPEIRGTRTASRGKHLPGGKVIRAFNQGLELLDDEYDILCKFDADLVFPARYLENLVALFEENPRCGMAGGTCSVKSNQEWLPERLTSNDHLRGALKAYRKACFLEIGGLRSRMGWDTVDEMLARYYGWEVCIDPDLAVKHMKPTGERYMEGLARLQGEVFRDLRYGFVLAFFGALKLSLKKRSPGFFFECLNGFLQRPADYLLDSAQGKFLRKYRWNRMIRW